jgi:hypothetical protein
MEEDEKEEVKLSPELMKKFVPAKIFKDHVFIIL